MTMMLKELTAIICFARIASTVPYQYSAFPSMSSTPPFLMKQNFNSDSSSSSKYSVGYKSQDSGTTKVKKEFSNSEYQNLFAPDTVKRPYSTNEFTSFDDSYSTTAAPLQPQFPFPGQLRLNLPQSGYAPSSKPATASNKLFIHHDKPHHFVHDVVGHYITDVAGHKLKHVGEVLESGLLTEPIIHKLSFAKAALLQLLAIIGPLSAIKTIHVVAKASDPHPHHEPDHIDGYSPAPIPVPSEHSEFGHSHYPPTLVGMIMHFVAQLSKFNTEAKLHLIPNLLKVVSHASAASSHVSGHHPH